MASIQREMCKNSPKKPFPERIWNEVKGRNRESKVEYLDLKEFWNSFNGPSGSFFEKISAVRFILTEVSQKRERLIALEGHASRYRFPGPVFFWNHNLQFKL